MKFAHLESGKLDIQHL